jgi:hypothetical protein
LKDPVKLGFFGLKIYHLATLPQQDIFIDIPSMNVAICTYIHICSFLMKKTLFAGGERLAERQDRKSPAWDGIHGRHPYKSGISSHHICTYLPMSTTKLDQCAYVCMYVHFSDLKYGDNPTTSDKGVCF